MVSFCLFQFQPDNLIRCCYLSICTLFWLLLFLLNGWCPLVFSHVRITEYFFKEMISKSTECIYQYKLLNVQKSRILELPVKIIKHLPTTDTNLEEHNNKQWTSTYNVDHEYQVSTTVHKKTYHKFAQYQMVWRLLYYSHFFRTSSAASGIMEHNVSKRFNNYSKMFLSHIVTAIINHCRAIY